MIPVSTCAVALLIGVTATAPSAGIHDFLKSAGAASVLGIAVPVYEEAFKAVGAAVPLHGRWRRVKSKLWGAYYGALAGFGFGMVENLVVYSPKVGAGRAGGVLRVLGGQARVGQAGGAIRYCCGDSWGVELDRAASVLGFLKNLEGFITDI